METNLETGAAEQNLEVQNGEGAAEQPSLFETISKLNTQTPGVETQAELEIPEPIKAIIAQKEQQLQEVQGALAAWQNDPIYKTLNYTAGDKDKIKQIARQLAGEDYSKYPLEELLKMDGQRRGLNGDVLEKYVTREKGKYDSMEEDIDKQLMLSDLRQKFPTGSQDSDLLTQVEQEYKKRIQAKPTPEAVAEMQRKEFSVLDNVLQNFQKEGVAMDEKAFGSIKKDYEQFFWHPKERLPYQDDNGNINIGQFAYDRYVLNNLNTIIDSERKAAVEKYKRENAGLDQNRGNGVIPGGQPDVKRAQMQTNGIPTTLLDFKPVMDDKVVSFDALREGGINVKNYNKL